MIMKFRCAVFALLLTLAAPLSAFAQCSGQAPAGKFCGNSTGSLALPGFTTVPTGSLSPIAPQTVLANPTGSTAVPIATTTLPLGLTIPSPIITSGITGGGSNTNFYVRGADGNDSFCTGLTNAAYVSGAYPQNCATKTIATAVNKAVIQNYGLGNATINIGDSPSYTDVINLVGTWLGAGQISIIGNCSSPGNVIWTTTSAVNLTVANSSATISCLELRNPTGGFAELLANPGGVITIGAGMRFGVTDGDQGQAAGGTILIGGNYSIVGSMGSHFHSRKGGFIGQAPGLNSVTVTLSAGLTAANYFIGLNNARADLSGVTWAGSSLTGTKALIHGDSRLNAGGTNCSTLPGSSPVTLDTWGQCDNLFSGTIGLSGGAALASDALFTANSNTSASATPQTTQFHAVGANGSFVGYASDAYGVGVNLDTSRLSFGTAAAPTAVNAAAFIKTISAQALDSTASFGNVASLDFAAANSQTGTDHGGFMRGRVTPPGSTTLTEVWRAGVGFMIGSGLTDPGTGNLNLGGGILQANGVAPTGTGAYVRATSATMASLTVTGAFIATGLVTNADLVSPTITINGAACTLGASCAPPDSPLIIGTTAITGGTTLRVLYDNAGFVGEYTNTQLTALINPATASLSGALPAWPNNTTTFFRGDGTYASPATLTFGAHLISGGTSYNGSVGVTITSDATASNTTSTIMLRDGSGQVAATTFTGALAGNATTATSATSATNATNTAITDDTTTNATMNLTWVTSNTGNLPQKVTSTKLNFNPSTGVLSSTSFTGAGTGLTGTAASLTAGAVTTNANLTGAITSTGNATLLGSFSSANLSGALTDETGTGVAVFGTSPILSTVDARGTWTTGTSWTLPAYTLGGTVSGGGNNINNVIIGASTPLAGTFTTLIANTSITSPIHAGGSGAASTLTLESTSGAGTTDAIIGLTASQVERFRVTTGGLFNIGPAIAPDTLLTVNSNTGAPVASSAIGGTAQIHLVAPDGTIGGTVADVYGAQGLYISRHSSGTQASKTASAASTQSFGFAAQHWDGSVYATSAAIDFQTINLQSGSDHSGLVRIRTVASGATANTERLRVGQGLTIGDLTDPGVGGLRATGATIQLTGLGADTASVDATVCRIAATGLLVTGTGALGICLGTSGAQFKTAFAPMVGGLDEIARLHFQNYRYLDGFGDSGARMQYGLTAQDVETVLPDLVRHDAFGAAINFDSGALLFVGLRAIQQLKADNDKMRADIAELKKRIGAQ